MKHLIAASCCLLCSIWACDRGPAVDISGPSLEEMIASALEAGSGDEGRTIHGTPAATVYVEGILHYDRFREIDFDPARVDTVFLARGGEGRPGYEWARPMGVIHILLKDPFLDWVYPARVTPPFGFRAIARSEYSADWKMVEKVFPTPDRAGGDFDGDGELDYARLWTREDGEEWTLMAYLSSIPGDPVEVYRSDRPAELARRPVRAIPPGDHKTHRYYGIGPGHGDTTAVQHLEHAALHLGYTESEGNVFVWREESGAFERLAMY